MCQLKHSVEPNNHKHKVWHIKDNYILMNSHSRTLSSNKCIKKTLNTLREREREQECVCVCIPGYRCSNGARWGHRSSPPGCWPLPPAAQRPAGKAPGQEPKKKSTMTTKKRRRMKMTDDWKTWCCFWKENRRQDTMNCLCPLNCPGVRSKTHPLVSVS